MMAWPTDQIDRVVRPDDAQRAKLQGLQSAASRAADTIKAACPTDVPATPPARIAAVGQRLQAMLGGVETIQPALADFYNSLSDDQRARFNSMGRQLFAQKRVARTGILKDAFSRTHCSAISAFTRVFDALWRCSADPGSSQTPRV
jgi:hypothetical protein